MIESTGRGVVGAGKPLVSMVIATFNRWPLVSETIQSVLDQTFQDFEIIVVDDGSTDGTPDEIERAFPTVRLIRQENTERGAAYNRGFRESTGQYVTVLGSDDFCEPWHFAQLIDALNSVGHAPAFASRAWLWDSKTGRRLLLPDFNPASLSSDALVGTAIQPQTLFVERSTLMAVGGYPEQRSTAGSEDWVLLLKLAHRLQIHPLPLASVRIREHPGRSTADLRFIAASREAAAKLILEEGLLGFELDANAARIIRASTHRLSAAHYYGDGEMHLARARIRNVWETVGPWMALQWTGRLWLQTWLGPAGSLWARSLKERVTWR